MENYNWTDNPTECLVAECNPDILNECLMHLKYNNVRDSIPLFTAMTFDHILTGTDAIGWAMQGSLVTMTYPDAVNLIKELYAAGDDETYRDIECKKSADGRYIADIAQKDNIDDLYTASGIADFYILDSINNCFYLPRNDWFEQATVNPVNLNQYNEAGLPSIKGTFPANSYDPGSAKVTGPFYKYGDNSSSTYPVNGNAATGQCGTGFDAYRSSHIYGNSTTVQPSSSNKLLYYKVGNVVVNESLIDVGNVFSDLQLKMDADHSNDTNPYIIETYRNGTSWSRVWSDGWCEQGGFADKGVLNTASLTIPLLHKFVDTQYNISFSERYATPINSYTLVVVGIPTTTSFVIGKTGSSWQSSYWLACGYIG